MLKAVGIISEYDPFHNGHLYQLQQAKTQSNADLAVVVMSSNWTQRGEPAVFDKWMRTSMALANGADLVIELPIQSAVQPASIFANKAINLITSLQCDYLSFGCEHPEWNFRHLTSLDIPSLGNSNPDVPYPELFRQQLAEQGVDITSPNDTLAFWYAKALNDLNSSIKLVPVGRHQSGHNDSDIVNPIASGKAIRLALANGDAIANQVPYSTTKLKDMQPLFWTDFWPYLKYQIEQTDVADLRNIYQMTDGLEYRFKQQVLKADSFNDFVQRVKSKRYTYTRIQRLCVYVLFNITAAQIKLAQPTLRILGMNSLGQQYLHQLKGKTSLPIISKIGKSEFNERLYLECKAGLLTKMVNGKEQDLYRQPLRE